MQYSFFRLMLTLILNLVISLPVSAKLIEEKSLHFPIKSEELMKGDIHYYFSLQTPRKMLEIFPEVFDLDSLSLLNEAQAMMILTKSVYIVRKPIGFFDENQMTDEKFFSHMMSDHKVTKLSPDSFKISATKDQQYTYKVQTFFDADDISTLPNSKITRAVMAAKRLDIISQGASTIMFSEYTGYSKFLLGGISAVSFVAVKEEHTLVIQYQLKAIKKNLADNKNIKLEIRRELNEQKKLLESFKTK